MPSEGAVTGRKDPTVTCPNCGALVPPALPECFICDEAMPGAASVLPSTMQHADKAEPTKAEVESAEEAFRKLEEDIPLDEELLPWGKEAGAGEQLTEDRIIDLMLEFEREMTPSPARTEEAVSDDAEEAGGQEVIRRETAIEVEGKSYKGMAIAAAGGFIYALSLILFIPLMGRIAAAVVIIPAALMIVGGSNMALRESAATVKAGEFSCPLCNQVLESSASRCTNCGAHFSD